MHGRIRISGEGGECTLKRAKIFTFGTHFATPNAPKVASEYFPTHGLRIYSLLDFPYKKRIYSYSGLRRIFSLPSECAPQHSPIIMQYTPRNFATNVFFIASDNKIELLPRQYANKYCSLGVTIISIGGITPLLLQYPSACTSCAASYQVSAARTSHPLHVPGTIPPRNPVAPVKLRHCSGTLHP
jgi:hypothetical protein